MLGKLHWYIKYKTKPPVYGGKWLFQWGCHLVIHFTDSFKRLINALSKYPHLTTYNLYDVFPVFGLSAQVNMKTTSVCRTVHYKMGHTYSVVQMQEFT